MIYVVAVWLSFVLATGVVAYFGNRRQAAAFCVVAALTLPATVLALGRPTPWQPAPGNHAVLGARIDQDVAIYILLDADPEPRFFRLRYSKRTADELQSAMDSLADGEGSVVMRMGEDGALGFKEETPPDDPPKRVETPLLVN